MNDEFLTHLIAALKKYISSCYVSKRRNSSEREEITFAQCNA
jgi:hypothetical protein